MSEPQQNEQPTEYKLLIELVYRKKRRLFKKMKYLVQNRPFKFGLRIKNIDDKTTPKGKIENLSFRSGEGGTIENGHDEKFSFPELNPGQEIVLWWPDPSATVIKGQTWIDCFVLPEDNQKTKFITYQYDRASNKEVRFRATNHWGDALSIRGELEQQQAMTNFLMAILTVLTFLDGVWGLDTIFKSLFKVFGWLFSQIGSIFFGLGH